MSFDIEPTTPVILRESPGREPIRHLSGNEDEGSASRKTLAGQSKRLDRAFTITFYRMAEALGIGRREARGGAARVDRALQIIGTVYLVVAAVVGLLWLLGEAMG